MYTSGGRVRYMPKYRVQSAVVSCTVERKYISVYTSPLFWPQSGEQSFMVLFDLYTWGYLYMLNTCAQSLIHQNTCHFSVQHCVNEYDAQYIKVRTRLKGALLLSCLPTASACGCAVDTAGCLREKQVSIRVTQTVFVCCCKQCRPLLSVLTSLRGARVGHIQPEYPAASTEL